MRDVRRRQAESVGERILYCADMLYFHGITTEGDRAKIIKRLRRDKDVLEYLKNSGQGLNEHGRCVGGYGGRNK